MVGDEDSGIWSHFMKARLNPFLLALLLGAPVAIFIAGWTYLDRCDGPGRQAMFLSGIISRTLDGFADPSGRCGNWQQLLASAPPDVQESFATRPFLLEYEFTVQAELSACVVLAKPRVWKYCRPTFVIDAAGRRRKVE